ncbi:MAG: hypothetical protein KDA21_00420, partial [Phycisphaerales bacterium]|nr:hypothetical protein [Phycisphaerales bacterium]
IEDMLRAAQASLTRAGESSSSASRRMDEAASRARDQNAGSREQNTPGNAAQPNRREPGQPGSTAPEQSGTQNQSGDQSGQSGQQGQAGQTGQAGESGQVGEQSPSNAQPQEQGEQGAERAADDPDEAGPRDQVPMDPDEAQAVEQEQQDVRDELLDLVEMLDRGEDTFVVRRKLENLAQAQAQLRDETARAAAQTTGRSADELTARERSEMERIVARQQELAQQMNELVEEMQAREEALRDADPAAAAGMAQAAARAQQQQTGQTMEQAAQEASQNQMTNAGQQQDQALRDLEQMQDDIEAGNRQRQEILQRMIASVIESIEGLIKVQEAELTALDQAAQTADYTGRDAAMIELSRNTLAVIDLLAAGGAEMSNITANVDRAYDAQVRAITALRREFLDEDAVRTHEEGSLEMLRRALDDAQAMAEQMQQDEMRRRFEELQRAYRDILEQQIALINETEPFAELDELSRRDRVQVRKLSDRQDANRLALEAVRQSTEEIAEARLFDYAHDRVNALMDQATVSLSEAEPARALNAERLAARLLQSIIEALQDQQDEDRPFDEGGGAAAGGGGGGGPGGDEPLIPPMKELLLLKQMQITIGEATIEAEEQGGDQSLAETLGDDQQQLFELAQDLLERMAQPAAPPGGFDLDEVDDPNLPPEPEGGAPDGNDASAPVEVPQS